VFKAIPIELNCGGHQIGSDCGSFCLGGWVRSAPLSFALQARFQVYIEEGLSGHAVAMRLKLSGPVSLSCCSDYSLMRP
jgi:hypothetical protein